MSRSEDGERQVNRIAASYWDQFLADEPLVATDIGEPGRDHMLPDLGDEAISNQIGHYQRLSASLSSWTLRRILTPSAGGSFGCWSSMRNVRREWLERGEYIRAFASHLDGPVQLLAQLAAIQRILDETTLE